MLDRPAGGGAEPPELAPGMRVDDDARRSVFYTHASSADPLAGLMVKWVFAPGDDCSPQSRDLPTLDLANEDFVTAA